MLAGGEQPLYIARRLVRAAVEDIGLADPQAVVQAMAAKDVYDFLGSPEGEIALVAVRALSRQRAEIERRLHGAWAPRSSAAGEHGSLMPPAHILNAPTKLMKKLGYGKGYEYDHEAEDGFSGQNYFPDGMAASEFLSAERHRLRTRDPEASGILGQAASQAKSGRVTPRPCGNSLF